MLRLLICTLVMSVGLVAQEQKPVNRTDLPSDSIHLAAENKQMQSASQTALEGSGVIERSDASIISGFGYLNGGDYNRIITDIFESRGYSVSGFIAFLNIELGFEFRVKKHFFIYPRFRFLFNSIKSKDQLFNSGIESAYINSMFTYGIGGRYYLSENLPHCFYLQGEIGGFSTQSDMYDIIPDGLDTGVMMGYQYNWRTRGFGFEIGYKWMPVLLKTAIVQWSTYPSYAVVTASNVRKDFGGFFINITGRFQIFNYTDKDE
jgi:hypothetical protein